MEAKHDNKNHWLSRLLDPAAIAFVGASTKPGSIGNAVLRICRNHGYTGRIYPVNPRYRNIDGVSCFRSVADLPEAPDLVVFAIGSRDLEHELESAIATGAGGAVIFANNYLPNDGHPPLLDRLRQKAREANFPVCGGNGMGFYNYTSKVFVSFDQPPDRPDGHIALIAHSGSVMTYLANNDPRYTFNLAVSPGQEINGNVSDYMDFALQQPDTRVIALFIETVREPDKFVDVLLKARASDIPVVVAKVGATDKSARFAASHSGAMAGDDAAFQAICDRHSAIRVRDIDELITTAMTLAQPRRVGRGGLASIFDSGGLREQFIDLADTKNIPFAEIADHTRARLAHVLEFGLEADNPLDIMGALNADVGTIAEECGRALLDDPEVAMLTFEFEFRDQFCQYPALFDAVYALKDHCSKPLLLLSSSTTTGNVAKATELTHAGLPVIDGADLALKAIRNMFWYRDHRLEPAVVEDTFHLSQRVARWQRRFSNATHLDQATSFRMLAEFGLPLVPSEQVESVDAALQAAARLGYPVVLKTGNPDVHHKSDIGGVALDLLDENQLRAAYRQLADALGPRAIVMPMVERGVELCFGMINDPQFGPVAMASAGGVNIEVLDDKACALAPFSQQHAKHMIESLKVNKLLRGHRGNKPYDTESAAEALSRVSSLTYELREHIQELDLNPVIVHSRGCVIVDALIVLTAQ